MDVDDDPSPDPAPFAPPPRNVLISEADDVSFLLALTAATLPARAPEPPQPPPPPHPRSRRSTSRGRAASPSDLRPRLHPRGRSAGRGATRRFINDNFLHARMLFGMLWNPAAAWSEEELAHRLEHMAVRLPPSVSFLAPLTADRELLRAFRRGEGVPTPAHAAAPAREAMTLRALLRGCYARVERGARPALLREARRTLAALRAGGGEGPPPLLLALEARLQRFMDDPRGGAGVPCASALVAPARASAAACGGPALDFELSEPFHRLLLHALCAFYSLRSLGLDAADGRRLVRVSLRAGAELAVQAAAGCAADGEGALERAAAAGAAAGEGAFPPSVYLSARARLAAAWAGAEAGRLAVQLRGAVGGGGEGVGAEGDPDCVAAIEGSGNGRLSSRLDGQGGPASDAATSMQDALLAANAGVARLTIAAQEEGAAVVEAGVAARSEAEASCAFARLSVAADAGRAPAPGRRASALPALDPTERVPSVPLLLLHVQAMAVARV